MINSGLERFTINCIPTTGARDMPPRWREGLRRKVLPIRGEWIDNYHYAIVEGDQTY